MTQNSLGFDIRAYLISQGVTEAIFIGKEPVTPDLCVTLYQGSFNSPNPKFLLNEPSLQVRVRSNSYETGYQLIQDIYNTLLGALPFTLNTTRYSGILGISDILDIGRDENERFLFVWNARFYVEPLKTTQNRTQL